MGELRRSDCEIFANFRCCVLFSPCWGWGWRWPRRRAGPCGTGSGRPSSRWGCSRPGTRLHSTSRIIYHPLVISWACGQYVKLDHHQSIILLQQVGERKKIHKSGCWQHFSDFSLVNRHNWQWREETFETTWNDLRLEFEEYVGSLLYFVFLYF